MKTFETWMPFLFTDEAGADLALINFYKYYFKLSDERFQYFVGQASLLFNYYQETQSTIFQNFKCTNHPELKECSPFEMLTRQFSKASLTRNPLYNLAPLDSYRDLNSSLPAKPELYWQRDLEDEKTIFT